MTEHKYRVYLQEDDVTVLANDWELDSNLKELIFFNEEHRIKGIFNFNNIQGFNEIS